MGLMNTRSHLTPALHQLETWMPVTLEIHSFWTSQPHLAHHLHWVSHFPPPPSCWTSLNGWTSLSFLIQLLPTNVMVLSHQVPSCPPRPSPVHPHQMSQPRHSKPPPYSTALEDCASNWCLRRRPGFKANVTPDCFKEKPGPNGLEASSIQFGIYQSKRILHLLRSMSQFKSMSSTACRKDKVFFFFCSFNVFFAVKPFLISYSSKTDSLDFMFK